MLLGSPLRDEISRSGSASPDERNADSSCDACTTDFTRYGSRAAGFRTRGSRPSAQSRYRIMHDRFVLRNVSSGGTCSGGSSCAIQRVDLKPDSINAPNLSVKFAICRALNSVSCVLRCAAPRSVSVLTPCCGSIRGFG